MFCRAYQWLLSRSLAAADGPSPRLRRHLGRCGPCRLYHRRLAAVQARLRADAPAEGPLAEALVDRILRAAAADGAAPQSLPHRRLRWAGRPLHLRPRAIGLAVAACMGLAAAAYLLRPSAPPRGSRPGGDGTAVRPCPALPTDALAARFWPDVRELAAAPLEAEIRRMAADTRQIGTALLAPLPHWLLPPTVRPEEEQPPDGGSGGRKTPPPGEGGQDDPPPAAPGVRPPDAGPRPSSELPSASRWTFLL